jgi:beta-lactamase class A
LQQRLSPYEEGVVKKGLRIAVAVATAAVVISTRVVAADAGLAMLEPRLADITAKARGQVGVSVFHVETGARLFSFRGGQPFAMASVYKLPIAFELLTQIAERRLTFDQMVTIGASDIRSCCTLSRRHPNGGMRLTLRELLELMITESDNTSGDAVLRAVGGPPAVDRRLSSLGFGGIHVNRYEGAIAFDMMGVVDPPPESSWTLDEQRDLIDKVPLHDLIAARARYTADLRDTATPDDMAGFLVKLQRGELLPRPYTDLLLDLLARVKTGPHRLKNRLPEDTIVAHKTGTTAVVVNDAGIITLPKGGGHVAVAVFVMNGKNASAMQHVISDIGAAVYESFTGAPLPPPVVKSRPAGRARAARTARRGAARRP